MNRETIRFKKLCAFRLSYEAREILRKLAYTSRRSQTDLLEEAIQLLIVPKEKV